MNPVRIWRRGQEGWPRRYPLIQLPNAPLIASLAGRWLQRHRSGRVRRAGEWLATLGTLWWSGSEILRGSNLLRRLIGLLRLRGVLASGPLADASAALLRRVRG